MLVPTVILGLVLVGWLPLFYRRFRQDGKGRALFRASLWGPFMIVPVFIISEFTYELPAPLVYPLAFLGAPVLFNLYALLRHALRGSRLRSTSRRRSQRAGFVTNELFIVAALLVLGAFEALVAARALHLGWLLSMGAVMVVLAIIALVLSFVFTPKR